MNPLLPAGANRLVSKASRRLRAEPAPPEYPSNSRTFVHLDARLLPYWHTLFDICPALLKLDPPEGLNLFRSFMTWAYRNRPPLDWTYHLNVCRWLLGSPYRSQIDDEPIDVSLHGGLNHAQEPMAYFCVLARFGQKHPAQNDFLPVFERPALITKASQFGFLLCDFLLYRQRHLSRLLSFGRATISRSQRAKRTAKCALTGCYATQYALRG